MDSTKNGKVSGHSPSFRPPRGRHREMRPASVVGPGAYPHRAARSRRLFGTVVGRLIGLEGRGTPLVTYPASAAATPVTARTTVSLGESQVGQDVTLTFEEGDPRKPIVTGILQPPAGDLAGPGPGEPTKPEVVEIDGQRIVFTADNEVVLRCGEASITLTRAGKVLIRGAYVLTRSSGANRIKGAVVEIN